MLNQHQISPTLWAEARFKLEYAADARDYQQGVTP